jgi:hypothetical protein
LIHWLFHSIYATLFIVIVATNWQTWLLTPTAALLATGIGLVAVIFQRERALAVAKYSSIPLSIIALLMWAFFVPLAIPTPPFQSALVSDLERSNAKLRATQHNNVTAEAEAVARFLPNGMTVKEAEVVLRKEWFHCSPFQDVGVSEAARWGEKYRHYITCERTTNYHPFYMFG